MDKKYLDALECLERLDKMDFHRSIETYVPEIDSDVSETQWLSNTDEFYTIKQTLIKAQENTRSDEILQKYYQEGITLDSVRALKQERDNYKKVLEIIKEKKVNIELLNASSSVEDYNNEVIRNYGYAFSTNRILTQEEFDLLKRCC